MSDLEMSDLEIALEESLKLQAHYASLLNQYDGGERMIFKTPREWIIRLRKLGILPYPQPAVKADAQSCGHSKSEIVSSDEGTSYCGACERTA